MHQRELSKPDGRTLWLYSRRPIADDIVAPSPASEALHPNPHFRWHPFRGEWIAYASYRQGRTFMPPPEYNPLAVTRDPGNPTELPAGDYDIAVFQNRFPSLTQAAHDAPESVVATLPAHGQCEVVVFAQDAASKLGALPLDHIELLLEVWGQRTAALAAEKNIAYVLPFENRGVEVGVTLHHPHGQIYAYPFVPPVPKQMHGQEIAYYRQMRQALLEHYIELEIREKNRLIYLGPHAVAFVPAWARYPYEVWVAPRKAVSDFTALSAEQRNDLARALKTVLKKFDALWGRPFPYLMAWYQAPTDGCAHPETHLHAEFYPPYRTRDKLKFLAGTELAAGMFASDALPEAKALDLQAVEVNIDD